MKKVLVIGGGPAGMMAAAVAAEKGCEVTLFEKNEKLGKKLYITGKGRCNVTNAVDVEDLLQNIPTNPYFLYSALYSFDSFALIELLNRLGLPTKIERGNRVYPMSDKSSDVIRALEKYLRSNHVSVRLNTEVREILTQDNQVIGLITQEGETYLADKLIIATGGLSYPQTGSTGDGYTFAKAANHVITKLFPSLVPLRTLEKWVTELQGLSLKNVKAEVCIHNKIIYKDFGEMIFTHFGVSGPLILSASCFVYNKLNEKPVISIDLKPALTEKELDTRILRDFEKYKNKDFKNSLDDLLPQKLIPVIIELSKINPLKKIHDITKEERKELVYLLKNLKFTVIETTGFRDAVITSGGVSVDDINPSTMESKKVKGLYFAGEVIDVDGFTGGFNLQIAFSTGFLAGNQGGEI